MRPDNKTEHIFSLGKTKFMYMVIFGIASYFRIRLEENVKLSDCLIVSFDESLKSETHIWNECYFEMLFFSCVAGIVEPQRILDQ